MQLISIDTKFNKLFLTYYKNNEKKYNIYDVNKTNIIKHDLYIKENDYNNVMQEIVYNRKLKEVDINIEEKDESYEDVIGNKLKRIDINFNDFNKLKKLSDYKFYNDIKYESKFISHYFNDNKIDNLKVGFIDIELAYTSTDNMNNYNDEINIITLIVKDIITGKLKTYTLEVGNSGFTKEGVRIISCNNEKTLLRKLIKILNFEKLDIISGWNSKLFDIPYIIERGKKIISTEIENISPFGIISERKTRGLFGDEEHYYDIYGLPHLDYMDLYKINIYVKRDSYKLDNICEIELGANKIDVEQYGGYTEIWKKHFDKYVEYNIRDVELLEMLDKKLNLLEMMVELSYMTHSSIIDTPYRTILWDDYLFNILKEQNIIIPPKIKRENTSFAGAYVKQAKAGVYNNVVSFDLNSLYPNLMIQLNMSLETIKDEVYEKFSKRNYEQNIIDIIEKDIDISDARKDCSLSPIGIYFSNTKQGFIPKVISILYDNRRKVKNQMLKYEQELEKLLKEKID